MEQEEVIEINSLEIYKNSFNNYISNNYCNNKIIELREKYKNIVIDYDDIPEILEPTDTDLWIMKDQIEQDNKIDILKHLYNNIDELFIPKKKSIEGDFYLPGLSHLHNMGFKIKNTLNKNKHLDINIFEQTIYIFPIKKCILNIDLLLNNIYFEETNHYKSIFYISYLKSFMCIIHTIEDYEFCVKNHIIPKIGFQTWLYIRDKIKLLKKYYYDDKKILFVLIVKIYTNLGNKFIPFNIMSSTKFWRRIIAVSLLLTIILTTFQVVLVGFPDASLHISIIAIFLSSLFIYYVIGFYLILYILDSILESITFWARKFYYILIFFRKKKKQ